MSLVGPRRALDHEYARPLSSSTCAPVLSGGGILQYDELILQPSNNRCDSMSLRIMLLRCRSVLVNCSLIISNIFGPSYGTSEILREGRLILLSRSIPPMVRRRPGYPYFLWVSYSLARFA